jgi:hypothetical protein
MSTKSTIVLAVAAGFIGGLASRYSAPSPVLAQQGAGGGMPRPQGQTSIPQEIQAHKFLLVDEGGIVRGAFGFDKHGRPNIELMDVKGYKWPIGSSMRNSPELLPDMPRSK